MTPAPGARLPQVSTSFGSAGERLAAQRELAALVAQLQGELIPHGELSPGEALALRARMTPLDALGRPRESREVRLRVLNERGLAFEHPAPLADRRAWVLLESPRFGTVAAEIELSWCRYNEGGRYTSGGRFVQFLSQAGQVGELGLDRHSACEAWNSDLPQRAQRAHKQKGARTGQCSTDEILCGRPKFE